MVPASTLTYGSIFIIVTECPLAFSKVPSDAAVIPFPSPDTTPPVTNTNFGMLKTSNNKEEGASRYSSSGSSGSSTISDSSSSSSSSRTRSSATSATSKTSSMVSVSSSFRNLSTSLGFSPVLCSITL